MPSWIQKYTTQTTDIKIEICRKDIHRDQHLLWTSENPATHKLSRNNNNGPRGQSIGEETYRTLRKHVNLPSGQNRPRRNKPKRRVIKNPQTEWRTGEWWHYDTSEGSPNAFKEQWGNTHQSTQLYIWNTMLNMQLGRQGGALTHGKKNFINNARQRRKKANKSNKRKVAQGNPQIHHNQSL